MKTFYKAVCNTAQKSLSLEEAYTMLKINYDKAVQENLKNDFLSIADAIETLIYYDDSYSNKKFKEEIFWDKDENAKTLLVLIWKYI